MSKTSYPLKLPTSVKTAAQRLARCDRSVWRTRLSRITRITAATQRKASPEAMNSGMRNPAGPMPVWANSPPIDGPTISPTFHAAPW